MSKLNNDRAELIVLISDRQRHKVTSSGIGINGITVQAADNITYMDMWFDTSLTMKKQVATMCS